MMQFDLDQPPGQQLGGRKWCRVQVCRVLPTGSRDLELAAQTR
jgi:hypothetical protein